MKTVVARSHDQSHLKIREFLSIMYVGIGIKLRSKWFISRGSGSFQRAGAPTVCSSFRAVRQFLSFRVSPRRIEYDMYTTVHQESAYVGYLLGPMI